MFLKFLSVKRLFRGGSLVEKAICPSKGTVALANVGLAKAVALGTILARRIPPFLVLRLDPSFFLKFFMFIYYVNIN
jgi:hypothetical protein